MNPLDLFEILATVLPVLLLLGFGAAVALRSGVASLNTGPGVRQLLGNLGSTAMIVAAVLLAMALAQGMAGFRLGMSW